jgi:hypothetical protein
LHYKKYDYNIGKLLAVYALYNKGDYYCLFISAILFLFRNLLNHKKKQLVMAQENAISIVFSATEKEQLITALNTIANILKDKCKSLTPKERIQYGRVKYEKEVWIDKVKQHISQNPEKVPNYIDVPEFMQDYEAHKLLNELLTIIETQHHLMSDTNLLLGYDLDVNALMFYRSIKTSAQNNDQGARTIYEDLKQQFPGGGKKKMP